MGFVKIACIIAGFGWPVTAPVYSDAQMMLTNAGYQVYMDGWYAPATEFLGCDLVVGFSLGAMVASSPVLASDPRRAVILVDPVFGQECPNCQVVNGPSPLTHMIDWAVPSVRNKLQAAIASVKSTQR